MATYSQTARGMKVDTALGEDELLLTGFAGSEGISSLFSYRIDLLSERNSIPAVDILRTPICVTVKTADGTDRFIHGVVRRFTQLGRSEGLTAYRAELVPWFWFLSLSSDCKIFQNLSVPEIVEQVFTGLGYNDFQSKLVKTYPKRVFCVQYRESHLNFVSRLLEEEGIFYFFEHLKGKDVLVLADDNSALKPCPGQAAARMASTPGPWQEEDVVTDCECEDAVHTGKVTLRDYDPLQPALQLESSAAGKEPEEVYSYPGKYTALDEGERYARLQVEAEEVRQRVVRGSGTCRSFQSGYRFELKDHYRRDANQQYLLLELHHTAKSGDYRSWDSAPMDYRNEFLAIPYSVPFRPSQLTPKPAVRGSQTALVVGPAGEEIYTDNHGRVKVQFYWDRLGQKNENSSCWVRVSSAWAGKNWGAIQIPRMGQEVIVEFLEGDPDQPIITGRVYNADQTPPYALPSSQTQSGVKSRSSKGGGTENFNEIRFEDLKGSEEVYIHAELNKNEIVENDNSESIGHDEIIDVGNNQTVNVGKNRSKSVGENENTSVGKNRTENVGENETVSIAKNRTHTVGKVEKLAVGDNRQTSVAKSEKLDVTDDRAVTIGKKDNLKVGKALVINAGDEITITTGRASISMKKSGEIKIKGSDITIEGSGKINVKASSDLTMKGSKIGAN